MCNMDVCVLEQIACGYKNKILQPNVDRKIKHAMNFIYVALKHIFNVL